ncbi:hypothetical protein BCR33DRAFT_363811 [Rhizoclosmatium globosum]|uniref:G-protein coupled receptors family 1 profile domain-containing protein n=1 Tax=Rhizoclosmatium globosum TaxID=329046 RepID=A0A1Y2C049_9FUNG|nr:hypothetical protein BCR33DRAFT_363811 [Rhizoclosmatium globosum]|eukprot:ORY40391.1 hypothetical protein BCR33DRAFT_363811 [Rhizoclosmatium globosum]
MIFTAALCVSLAAVYGTSTTNISVMPDSKADQIQFIVWLITISAGCLVAFPVIIYCYASTYRYLSAQLREAMSNVRIDKWESMMQKRLLFNSITMALSVVLCYLPNVVVIVLYSAKVVDAASLTGKWLAVIAFFALALDVVITPILIMYFMNPIKRFRSGGMEDENEAEGEFELESEYKSSSGWH